MNGSTVKKFSTFTKLETMKSNDSSNTMKKQTTTARKRKSEPALHKAEVIPVQEQQLQQHTALPALQNTPDQLIAMAIQNGNISIDVLERLSKLQQEWLDRQARSTFKQAMSDFQSEVPAIPKAKNVNYRTKDGGTVDYNHAELDRMVTIIQPFKKKYGFSHEWKYEHFKDGEKPMIRVTCVVSHPSGHTESTSMEGEHDNSGGKNSIQSRGSTVTYLQRYTLKGAFGLTEAGIDNDGGKMNSNEPEQKATETTTKKAPPPSKPAMNIEQLNKAIVRITKGEDIIQICKDQFTLTDKQLQALNSADDIRVTNARNKLQKELDQQAKNAGQQP